jgi:RNA polymerase sigma-70 factor (ECF subfamily)
VLLFCINNEFDLVVAMETDSRLLSAARAMKKDAMVKIFDLYSSALFNYVMRLSGDSVLADHIVGDVFAKLFEQLSVGKGPTTNMRSYLYETAYHRLIDETRYARRRVTLEAADWHPRESHPVFLLVEDRILYKQVVHAIRKELTDDQRHVIVLRFLEHFSLRETAAIVGKREDHIKVIQGRALAILRRCLEKRGSRKALSASGTGSVLKLLEV